MVEDERFVTVPFGAWHGEQELQLSLPSGWRIYNLAPQDAAPLSKAQIDAAFSAPIGTERLSFLAKGKTTAAIAIDDITRPTPAYVFLPNIISELISGGISPAGIRIIIGAGAHRTMNAQEITKKLGAEVAKKFQPVVHDFIESETCFLGWVRGGPVYLNRHFLEADLKICVGGVMPHGETGFGGGAKMVVPGLAGRLTIAHFHGALPARPRGQLEAADGIYDRRSWTEDVAQHIGVDAIVCSVVNSAGNLAGLFIGDVVKSHRVAARKALEIGNTVVSEQLIKQADIVAVNTFPLDTDPVQMGKALDVAKTLGVKAIIAINAASDGIFYHGMGMGSGIDLKRLARNIPGFLFSFKNLYTWARSMLVAVSSPREIARLCYFSVNHLSYKNFEKYYPQVDSEISAKKINEEKAKIFLFSKKFPAWGLHQRYPKGRLYRNWEKLTETLNKQYPKATVVVLPCGPLQIVDFI